MLGLPQTTEVKRSLPKAQLFKRFDWTASQRELLGGLVDNIKPDRSTEDLLFQVMLDLGIELQRI